MTDIPVVVTAAGAQPTPPATLLADLLTIVSSVVPGYTATLPGSLIEDVSSTEVGALIICDTARIETINSLTPFGANDFMLSELGQIYIGPGFAPAVPTNTSVYVIFTAQSQGQPLPGFVIPIGFTVGDGTYQYIVQDGGQTLSDGSSEPLFCQASIAGTWAVAANIVSNIITQISNAGVTLTCTNPTPGISGAVAETSTQYRARVLQAGQAIATGTPELTKTLLGQVSGVQQRLISVLQDPTGWEVIVGGGDPYAVAGALFASGLNIQTLIGSTLAITDITQATAGLVTTDLNHGFTGTAQTIEINGVVGMTPLNGNEYMASVVTEKSFTINAATINFPAYISGGVITPNLRNVTVNLLNYPNVYTIPFVVPPLQTVTMTVSWNTSEPNFVSQASVAQLAATALADYINDIAVGQAINVGILNSTFQAAVANILDPSQISVLNFTVFINGIPTAPVVGTQTILGDPESYFDAVASGITVSQA
jgi:hypothetical protein